MGKFHLNFALRGFLVLAFFGGKAWAAADYHLVGWFNTFIPGGGQLLLGDPGLAAIQASVEVGTFGYGFYRSGRTPMTLDGAPEQLPSHSTATSTIISRKVTCVKYDIYHHCIQYKTATSTSTSYTVNNSELSLVVPLYADILQEIGLKYHMVNVFNAYREAARASGANAMIDHTATAELFKAPFRLENLSDPWVWGALLVSAAAVGFDYHYSINGYNTPVQPLTPWSNRLYAFDYAFMYPTGSAAPEEMFYRGFVQNEFYSMVRSPYFSIPMTSLAYAFSHSSDARPSAALTGLYLSFLAHRNNGMLSKGIAFHFWADLLAGISEILILHNAEQINPLPLLSMEFRF